MSKKRSMAPLIRPIIIGVISFLAIYLNDYITYSYFADWKDDMQLVHDKLEVLIEYRYSNQTNEYQKAKEETLAIYKRMEKRIDDNKKGKTILFYKSRIPEIKYVLYLDMSNARCTIDDL